jgi:hypothetical protein
VHQLQHVRDGSILRCLEASGIQQAQRCWGGGIDGPHTAEGRILRPMCDTGVSNQTLQLKTPHPHMDIAAAGVDTR